MTQLEKITFIKLLAEQARASWKDNHAEMFDAVMQKLIDAEPGGIVKSELFGFIADEQFKGLQKWHSKLLICGLIENPTPATAINDLTVMLFFGKSVNFTDAEPIKEHIVRLCDMFFDDVRFYQFGAMMLLNEDIFEAVIPKMFRIEAWKNIEKFLNVITAEPTKYLFIEQNYVRVNPEIEGFSDEDFFLNEMTDALKMRMAANKHPFDIQEKLYRSCFDEQEHPDMKKLEQAATTSAKAAHLLMKIEEMDYEAWYS